MQSKCIVMYCGEQTKMPTLHTNEDRKEQQTNVYYNWESWMVGKFVKIETLDKITTALHKIYPVKCTQGEWKPNYSEITHYHPKWVNAVLGKANKCTIFSDKCWRTN